MNIVRLEQKSWIVFILVGLLGLGMARASDIPQLETAEETVCSAPAESPIVAATVPELDVLEEPEDEEDAEDEEQVEESEPLDEIDNPYAELALTTSEKKLLARMAYSEAGNQSFEGQVAVIQVALNRYLHEAFSGSISDIVLAPSQFAVGSHYGEEQMEAVEAALAGHTALDLNTDVVFFSTGSLTYGSYFKTIGSHVFRTYH